MRLLCIHSAPFSFEATEKTKFAEEIVEPVAAEGSADNALVAFVAAEKPDEAAPAEVAARAVEEIIKTAKTAAAETIVLYPYSHLSNNLARPQKAVEILQDMRRALADCKTIFCPFGWYKKFSMNGTGHPVSELSRVIEPAGKSGAPAERIMSGGREHPVAAMNQKFREVFLELGLDEMINPAIVDDIHVYKQYGPEAPLILDRVFYLAGLERADIGLSKAKLEAIRKIAPDFSREDELQSLFREYKEAQIEADDFLEEMALRLKLPGSAAAEILDTVFPEFKELKPVPTHRTLRSHMTSNWFPVLQSVRGKRPLPVKLFSVGSRFRREQRQDPTHLFESTSASVVVMDRNLSMDDGRKLVADILNKMGFRKCTFTKKKIASRYYDPETDTEVFVKYQGQMLEVGNLGFYAPASLAKYDIDLPVFNIGFGTERMAMILTSAKDLRALVFPQFYEEVSFDDAQIARMLRPRETPEDPALKAALPDMVSRAVAAKDSPGPAQAVLFDGEIAGKKAKITAFNWDEGKPMLSMAAMNRVYVHDANIYGLPEDRSAGGDKFAEIYDAGARTELRFIDLIVAGFATAAERAIREGAAGPLEERLKIAKRPFQINLHIPDEAYDYIQRLQHAIKVGGPLFFGLRAEW